MNIAKHSKGSSSQRLQKKQFLYWIKSNPNIISAMLLASLIGTYLDLYFVGKGLYLFPIRPMPTIFSINIAFTLIILPLFTCAFLYICSNINSLQKAGFMIILSMLMVIVEKRAEEYGFFVANESWNHSYTFIGYILFLLGIYLYYHWSERKTS